MTNFLLEIFSEEIPAKMQKPAAENLAKIANEVLAKNNLNFKSEQILTFVTPRRLVLYVKNLEKLQKTPEVKKVGPKVDADKKAIEGFLRSNGLKDESQLTKVDNNGNLCFSYTKLASEVETKKIIEDSLPQIFQKMTAAWPKLMRFDIDGGQAKWIRPVRNILALFDSEIVKAEFAGLKSNNITYGHYANNKSEIKIDSTENYQEVLRRNFVILDQEERKQIIVDQISKIANSINCKTIDNLQNSPLLDEVCGLCEFPTALLGKIENKFMDLPPEILILTLKLNQKYFCLTDNENRLLPNFIFVSNAIITDSNKTKIISDNEKLVRARLSDAQFFVDEDLKKPLIERLDDLKLVVFHQKLGSVYDKTLRLKNLAKFLSIFVPHSDISLVEKSVDLCKSDLVTKAVAELPELQGKIGSFYATKQKFNEKISSAIAEHYLPLGPSSELPKTALGITLSIADKIDSIVGFFLADEKPTSSKDPYALRRSVLGIIRIGFEYNIAFPIRILVQKSIDAYPTKLLKELLKDSIKDKSENLLLAKKNLEEEIVKFFVERLKSYLKENESLRPDIINAVIEEYLSNLDAHKNCDILYLANKIKFLDSFCQNKENRNIIELYKRSANILAIEEKKDGKKYESKPNLLWLKKTKHEITLYRRIKQIRPEFKKLVIKGEFEAAFKLFNVLEIPLAHFFDNVVINDKNKNIRENRLMILAKIRALFNQVADLSKIEI
ncbi:MAG: glycine--tRNA ligase subunit beta [Pelagibacterales bacterium]|nr:glycine--tRNA ligase subunit beta [Pelagibacterales bacterium]